MADNYLEKRMEDYLSSGKKTNNFASRVHNVRRKSQCVAVVGYNHLTPMLLKLLGEKGFRVSLLAPDTKDALQAVRDCGVRLYPTESVGVERRISETVDYFGKVDQWIVSEPFHSRHIDDIRRISTTSNIWLITEEEHDTIGGASVFTIGKGTDPAVALPILVSILQFGNNIKVTVDK